MSHSAIHSQNSGQAASRPFPLFPLLSAGSLVLVSLLSVAWVRWFAEPAPEAALQAQVLVARELSFKDLPDGSVGAYDATDGALVYQFASGEHGFVRATLRGLARTRRALGAGAEVPFRLEQRSTGQLILIDLVTGQEVDLWAFGESNARGFELLLSVNTDGNGPRLSYNAAGPDIPGVKPEHERSMKDE